MGQWSLLRERRFWPLFWTQYFGAFNDNVFRTALAVLIAYRSVSLLGLGPDRLVVACTGIFILPFFLFSATAGQLADRFPKSHLIRCVKAAEVLFMALAAVGFATSNMGLLLVVLFLMGAHSAFFGPAKYSILPELLDDRSLVGGNALVQMATFVAIILGNMLGAELVARGPEWVSRAGAAVVTVAALGLAASAMIPSTRSSSPGLDVSFDPVTPTLAILRVAAKRRTVFLSILGLSWFWFVGASFLALIPHFSLDVLRGSERVVTLVLGVFCVGIATGCMLCERLSRRRLELGLVPFGSLGMSLFAFDLAWSCGHLDVGLPGDSLRGVVELLRSSGSPRVIADLFLLAASTGFFTVPLYTLVQQRSAQAERSRVIAGNNILNALFMVVASLILMALLALGLSIPWIFTVLAGLNLVVAAYIYTVIPEFLLRFGAWLVANVLYRVRVEGGERMPAHGPALLVANHVSYVDWLLIASVAPRPVRFVMRRDFMTVPGLKLLLRDAKVIPVAAGSDDPTDQDESLGGIVAELEAGELVCLFPEGGLTADGRLSRFSSGVERVVELAPVPVVPIALTGLWGSFFSCRYGRPMSRPLRRLWSRVGVVIGEPVPAAQVSAQLLAERVAALGGWEVPGE